MKGYDKWLMNKLSIYLLAAFALLLAACSSGQIHSEPTPDLSALEPGAEVTEEAYFIPSLGFDAIRPIYVPNFASADQVNLKPDDLIIGVAMGDEAKAYPLKVLRFREMVNDEIDGRPILVTF